MNYLGRFIFQLTCLLVFGAGSIRPLHGENLSAQTHATLDQLFPLLTSRRLDAKDFFDSRTLWASLFGHVEMEVRVRELVQEGEWLRIRFDQTKEGKPDSGTVYQLAWNLVEQGPAPFVRYQSLRIWVSPSGSVDGFCLGHSVHSWRQREDGWVELQVVTRMADGGFGLVQMIPDRYAGGGTGTTMFWKGEGLSVGAVGVPVLHEEFADEELKLLATLEGDYASVGDGFHPKLGIVPSGLTAYMDEIHLVLRDLRESAVPETLIPVGGKPAKIRLRSRKDRDADGEKRKKGGKILRKVFGSKKESGRSSSSSNERGGGPKPQATRTSNPTSTQAPGTSEPTTASNSSSEEAGLEEEMTEPLPPVGGGGELIQTQSKSAWVRRHEQTALTHRKKAFEQFSSHEAPGVGSSREWVRVRFESLPGEPLKADEESLPLVPRLQLVQEARFDL